MSMYPQSGLRRPFELDYARDDRTLQKFFNVVYSWMAVGIAVTAVVAYLLAQSPSAMKVIYGSRVLLIACALTAFVIAIGVQKAFLRIHANVATALFLLYAGLIGVMSAYIFLVYSPAVIIASFGVSAGTFAGMSLVGFFIKKDLSGIGRILIMCVWGLLLASIINIWVASGPLDWLITYAILAVFIGLTAYETQMLKHIALQIGDDPSLAPKFAIYGSLILYISFINIFFSILRILGDRR